MKRKRLSVFQFTERFVSSAVNAYYKLVALGAARWRPSTDARVSRCAFCRVSRTDCVLIAVQPTGDLAGSRDG